MVGDPLILAEFDISPSLGFLSCLAPTARLPKEYDSWEQIASGLPGLIAQGQLKKRIASLATIETAYLTVELQWKRAYVLLAFITHAYVWGNGTKIDTVPPALSEPFLQVCTHLGMQPVLSYAGLCLWNWETCKQEAPHDLCNLRTSASFTGTADEAAFYLVPVMVEAEGGHLVATLLNTIDAAAREDWDAVSTALKRCDATLRQMIDVLALLNSHCDPFVFFGRLRPFLAGLEVTFARASGEDVRVKCVGGSAAQSALFMSIDRLLGVKHRSTLFVEMRPYMPGKHRRFLEVLERRVSLSEILEGHNAPVGVRALFTSCVQALQDWRGKHIAIVSRYVVLPARRAMAAADGGSGSHALVGTGGSPLVEFLKGSRDETVVAPPDGSRDAPVFLEGRSA